MPQYGFRIVFSWFWVLQGTSGNDLRSLFTTIFEAKSIGFRIRFRYFVDEENSDFGPIRSRCLGNDLRSLFAAMFKAK